MNQQEWDDKIQELGGGILQSWDWGRFQESVGHKVERVLDKDWAAQLIQTDLMMNKTYWYAPRGPVGNTDRAVTHLRQWANDQKSVMFLRLEPNQPASASQNLMQSSKTIQPQLNWVLGLEGSEQELLVGMKPKHRYNINLAAKKGVTVREATKQDFLEVWRLLLETAGRGKFKLHPQNYYLQMWETLGPDKFKILLAEYEGQPLACVLVSFFGHTATYLHGGSSDKLKNVMAPYLLHWETIVLAKHAGYYNYDFGGITTDPNHSWSGISRFKMGFGGFEVRYPGTYDLVLSPLWYNVYKSGRKLRSLLR